MCGGFGEEKGMNCCQCQGIEELFNQETVDKELAHYRKKGPDKTTRWLIDAIRAEGVQGQTLLDVGGGLGSIQHMLFEAGLSRATHVDASRAYLNAAQREAQRRGLSDRIAFRHGNFVDMAPEIDSADVVTLDRVVCCYPDMLNLVSRSAARAGHLYGLVYPRDEWWTHLGLSILNGYMRLRKSPFRTFVHSTRQVENLLAGLGFQRRFYRQTKIWQVVVFAR
jgi:hypothetical protein